MELLINAFNATTTRPTPGNRCSFTNLRRFRRCEADKWPRPPAHGERPVISVVAIRPGLPAGRRLVQAGVTFIEVRSNGWDTHKQNHENVGKLAQGVDPGFAALINDLKQRGMLEQTLVVWMGEFGRTPKINPNGGRDHFPKVFNVALAGGGVRGGQVIGRVNTRTAPTSKNNLGQCLRPADVAVSCLLKVDSAKEMMSPIGPPDQDRRARRGKIVSGLFG